MPNPKKLWTRYHPNYVSLAKSLATASLPALYGPLPRGDAFAFRRGFYRFRDALGEAQTTSRDSLPDQLYQTVQPLSAKLECTNGCHACKDPSHLHNIIFDLDPVIAVMNRMDPAAAQAGQLASAHLAKALRPAQLSTPLFSDDEMQERLDDLKQ